MLSHEGPGLDEHVKGRAVRLAALGYCAFALDYHGGGEPIYDMEKMFERLNALIGQLLMLVLGQTGSGSD